MRHRDYPCSYGRIGFDDRKQRALPRGDFDQVADLQTECGQVRRVHVRRIVPNAASGEAVVDGGVHHSADATAD
jgi:hypothetical protein